MKRLSDLSRPVLGPKQLPVPRVPGIFPWVKAAGAWRGVDNQPSSSAEVEERVELYITTFSAFIACSRANFTFLRFISFNIWVFVRKHVQVLTLLSLIYST